MLGLKREAIGATHSINRETNLALITDMYGPDSPETRGSLSIYVVGGMIGTIYFGFMVSIIASLNIFHPYALGMSSGVGAGIMMASATAAVSYTHLDVYKRQPSGRTLKVSGTSSFVTSHHLDISFG